MNKIHFIEFTQKQNGVLVTLIFDLNKVELVERKNNEIFLFTPEKVTTLVYDTIEEATLECVRLFDYWKYGFRPNDSSDFENN